MHDISKLAFWIVPFAAVFMTVVEAERAIGDDKPPPVDEKRVVVDKTKFSDVYPAVWFSPSSGEISPLKKKSEVPPAKKYEIWIEPGDPEFAFGPNTKRPGVGFQLLGNGDDVFREAVAPKKPELSPDLEKLMRKSDGTEMSVFYCKAMNSECLIMITTLDNKNEVIGFRWRPLRQRR